MSKFNSTCRNCQFIYAGFSYTIVAIKHCTKNLKNKHGLRRRIKRANRSSNTTAVPEAKGALDRFKMEVASELGVPLTDGYNGNLTSRQNGSVGGYMVKKMIENQERMMSGQGSMSGTGSMSGQGSQY